MFRRMPGENSYILTHQILISLMKNDVAINFVWKGTSRLPSGENKFRLVEYKTIYSLIFSKTLFSVLAHVVALISFKSFQLLSEADFRRKLTPP